MKDVTTGPTAMATLPLNLLDELYLNLDRATEPWTVHYELHLETHVDPARLARAVSGAARRHPLARARLMSWRLQDRAYDWEIVDELDDVPRTTKQTGLLGRGSEQEAMRRLLAGARSGRSGV